MNITAMSLTNGTLTVIVDNGAEILTACSDHPKWEEIKIAYKSQNQSRLLALLSLSAVVEEYTIGQLSVNSTGVTYNGHPLHTVDSDRVLAFLREGLPYQPIANYISRKMANPSSRAITELYQFLEHKNMPITPEGFIVAYKGVRHDFYSMTGNNETIVLQGTVNSQGQILNEIGKVIEVQRNCVNDNFKMHCAEGLHAGSLLYAKGFGPRIILVSIDPADVVSVPDDCDCQKLRCCKYKVLGEYTGTMPNTLTTEFSTPLNIGEESNDNECTCGNSDCSHCNSDNLPPYNIYSDEQADAASALEKKVISPLPPVFFTDKIVASNVLNILKEQQGIERELFLSDSVHKLGIDSLDLVEICMALEEFFHIEIPDEELERIGNQPDTTIQNIVDYIRKQTVKVPIPATSHLNTDMYENEYLEGMKKGVADRAIGATAQFLVGDQTSADSPQHSRYIDGYLCGFA
jgi:acyl carrier protein